MKRVSEYDWGPAHIPWTVIGKGPSWKNVLKCSPPGFRMGINDVVCEIPVNVAILSDYNYPHMARMAPHIAKNDTVVFILDDLRGNNEQGMCVHSGIPTETRTDIPWPMDLWHNRTYLFGMNREGAEVQNNHVSTVEAAVQIILNNIPDLCQLFTCGIDGGKSYAPEFKRDHCDNVDYDRNPKALKATLARYGRDVISW
jgi:hypothetical protein